MANEGNPVDVTLVAGESFETKQFYLAKGSGTGVVLATAAADLTIGSIQNHPASGHGAQIRVGGRGKTICGASFSAWAYLTSDSAGKAVEATAGQRYCGIALEAGAANRIISMFHERGYVPVGT